MSHLYKKIFANPSTSIYVTYEWHWKHRSCSAERIYYKDQREIFQNKEATVKPCISAIKRKDMKKDIWKKRKKRHAQAMQTTYG